MARHRCAQNKIRAHRYLRAGCIGHSGSQQLQRHTNCAHSHMARALYAPLPHFMLVPATLARAAFANYSRWHRAAWQNAASLRASPLPQRRTRCKTITRATRQHRLATTRAFCTAKLLAYTASGRASSCGSFASAAARWCGAGKLEPAPKRRHAQTPRAAFLPTFCPTRRLKPLRLYTKAGGFMASGSSGAQHRLWRVSGVHIASSRER